MKPALTELDVYYDFASPNAYFAHEVLKDIAARTGLVVRNHPVLIGGIFTATNNTPPLIAHAKCQPKIAYMHLEIKRFIARHNLTRFKFNSAFPVNTLLPMRVAVQLLGDDRHDAFVDRLMQATWEDNLDISQADVLASQLDALGFDGAALIEHTQNPDVKKALIEATQACVDRGVFGLPTLFAGDDMYFGKDTLWQIEALATSAAK